MNDALSKLGQMLAAYEPECSLDSTDCHQQATPVESPDENALMKYSYVLYEYSSNVWNRRCPEIASAWDEKVWDKGTLLTFGGGFDDANFEHAFTIQRIQAKIRRHWLQLEKMNGQPEYRAQSLQNIKAELDNWKAMIPLVASNVNEATVCHPISLLMLYNYSICCLYQNEIVVPTLDDYSILLAAAGENARCFQRIQGHQPMILYTWDWLYSQFTISVILLSCFWGTPYMYRTTAYQAPDTLQAVEDCELTLARFAQRWEAAEIYLETFQLILSETPISFPHNPNFVLSDPSKLRAINLIQSLEKGKIPVSVIAMLKRIVNQPVAEHTQMY
ncbi:binuclear zinc transcription factor [Colletotrichum tabaci]|uniref:Binuclear zinc transcription factor n=1 Tax=Colletotrichum tabaci TaxID=1209068 RepID=A0AAV9TQ62_9PEZI